MLQVLSHLLRETGQVERAIADPSGPPGPTRPDPRRAGPRPGQPRAPTSARPASSTAPTTRLRGGARLRPQQHLRPHGPAEGLRGPAPVARGLRASRPGCRGCARPTTASCSGTCRPRWARRRPARATRRRGRGVRSRPPSPSTAASSPPTSGLADLYLESEPARAAAVLEDATSAPRRSAPTWPSTAWSAPTPPCGEPARFVAAVRAPHPPGPGRLPGAAGPRPPSPRPRAPRGGLRPAAARARSEPPGAGGAPRDARRPCARRAPWARPSCAYLGAAERAVFYADPHLCTSCRYRADGMLWRCPHCHEWNTFVEERLGPMAGRSLTAAGAGVHGAERLAPSERARRSAARGPPAPRPGRAVRASTSPRLARAGGVARAPDRRQHGLDAAGRAEPPHRRRPATRP